MKHVLPFQTHELIWYEECLMTHTSQEQTQAHSVLHTSIPSMHLQWLLSLPRFIMRPSTCYDLPTLFLSSCLCGFLSPVWLSTERTWHKLENWKEFLQSNIKENKTQHEWAGKRKWQPKAKKKQKKKTLLRSGLLLQDLSECSQVFL